MRALALAAALLAVAGPVRAQPRPDAPDITQHDDDKLAGAVASKKEARRRRAREPLTPVAQAISLAFGTTFFSEVRVSTMGAAVDLSRLSREGFYKLELIQLLLISSKSKTPLAKLAERRRKGDALRDIAFQNGQDYDRVYDASLAVQEIVDRDYLPRFPQRRPRKERDEP